MDNETEPYPKLLHSRRAIDAQGETMPDTDITKILVGIGRLEAKADATNDHLATLNGSVKTLYGKAETNKNANEALKIELLQHQIDCPGLKVINEINSKLESGNFHGSLEVREKLAATEAANKEDKKWIEHLLYPALKWLLMGLFILLLLHANDILKAVKP